MSMIYQPFMDYLVYDDKTGNSKLDDKAPKEIKEQYEEWKANREKLSKKGILI